jgi:phosphatidylglycerol---prolipoprotein diacylglyceryl transferase
VIAFLIPFPSLDPVMINIGPLPVRWYGLAYAGAILWVCFYSKRLFKVYPSTTKLVILDELIVPLIVGIVVGGRLGYIIFYNLEHFLKSPLEIFMTWQGGMSFHGGLVGVIVALSWYAHRQHLPFLAVTDVIAVGTPMGLFLGRLANFINGEHYGRVTSVPWAVIFPNGGPLPRHPSQLYEAVGEGLVIWGLLYSIWKWYPKYWIRPGGMSGIFLLSYGLIRSFLELLRQPDGVVMSGTCFELTLGQILCLPMIMGGLYLSWPHANPSHQPS